MLVLARRVRADGSPASSATITAIGAENEYANVIAQVGGKYVNVTAIESNPNTDPHTYEASPAVAREISSAGLIVQNGVGYDTWATTIENAAPDSGRKVINVQQLLSLPDSTSNPHLWYKPTANARPSPTPLAADLAALDPAHASYFKANAASFIARLTVPGTRPSPRSRPPTRVPRWRPPEPVADSTCSRPSVPTT